MTTTPAELVAAADAVKAAEAAVKAADDAVLAAERMIGAARDAAYNTKHTLAEAIGAKEAREYDAGTARLALAAARRSLLELASAP